MRGGSGIVGRGRGRGGFVERGFGRLRRAEWDSRMLLFMKHDVR